MRQPKLRKKKVGKHTYGYTEANGGAYFGKVGEVPYKDAKHHFGEHIKQKQAPIEEEVHSRYCAASAGRRDRPPPTARRCRRGRFQ